MIRQDQDPRYTEESRAASLKAILPQARKDAAEWNVPVYIIHAPIYVDEHAEPGTEHVYAGRDACDIMFPKRDSWTAAGIIWHLDAHIDKDGEPFFTRVADVMTFLAAGPRTA